MRQQQADRADMVFVRVGQEDRIDAVALLLKEGHVGHDQINAGRIIDDGASIEEVGQEIFDLLLAVASGKPSLSEAQGLGDNEFVPWQMGAVM